MYSIGEIAKMVNVSVDALRYYDQIHLLKPHHVNEENRYRFYSQEQVRELLFILEMKNYGFSLDAIRELLVNRDPARIEGALKARLQELDIEQKKTADTIRHLALRLQNHYGEDEHPMKQCTVMIVDDVAFMRLMLRDILEKHGYKVVAEALDGHEAIGKFTAHRPDMIIMDIHMPEGLDGIQAAAQIMAIDAKATIVMCTARGQVAHVLESIQAGAQAFIVKPFQQQSLIEALSNSRKKRLTPDNERIARWLADNTLAFPAEPAVQDVINQIIALCSVDEADSEIDAATKLAALLAEPWITSYPGELNKPYEPI